jgi:hypothetical protein
MGLTIAVGVGGIQSRMFMPPLSGIYSVMAYLAIKKH